MQTQEQKNTWRSNQKLSRYSSTAAKRYDARNGTYWRSEFTGAGGNIPSRLMRKRRKMFAAKVGIRIINHKPINNN